MMLKVGASTGCPFLVSSHEKATFIAVERWKLVTSLFCVISQSQSFGDGGRFAFQKAGDDFGHDVEAQFYPGFFFSHLV